MKKKLALLFLVFFVFTNYSFINTANAIRIVSKEKYDAFHRDIRLWDMFLFFASYYDNKIPNTYKYIDVKIKWVSKNSIYYDAIQKLIYVNKLENKDVIINPNRKIKAIVLYNFASKISGLNLINDWEISKLKNRNADYYDFEKIKNRIKIKELDLNLDSNIPKIKEKKKIFSDVYKTLNTRFYDKEKIDKVKMLEKATKALAEATNDKHTVYFPAVDNKNFNEAIKWEYEWIWAYVEMEKPWVFKIISPIAWSPAEKAWLKWWDIVLKVNWKEVKENNSISEVVSWIKWPAWTVVKLTIKRWNKIFDLEVTRWHIVLKEVEYKKLNYSTYYIKMKFFGPSIAREFNKALEDLKKQKNIKKIIFDLRWNWGWYLAQAVDILSHFVPAWQDTVFIKYLWYNDSYTSRWYDDIDFSKYKIIILQNGWTASASEIFIGTLKDYFPNSVIIWEKSYWKWSVQTIKQYSDGSSLKYTIAKWFTWKTHTGIDGIWINPDIEVKMDKYWVDLQNDKQLQRALKIR